jgi:cellulose synthase (UDP-forming)
VTQREGFYFSSFEGRRPPPPVPYSARREAVHHALAACALALGVWYLAWRWTVLNADALWVALPAALAETLAFAGSVLHTLATWTTRDTPTSAPPRAQGDVEPFGTERPIAVDVFIPTFNEDVELVRLSVRDAKAMRYPHPLDLRVHVLDDGARAQARVMARDEGVGYITRSTNEGYKAGNLRNAMEQTSGDLIVIFDADTRAFPEFLEETLGYFRDPNVAWVQTPQWFYDLDLGEPLAQWLGRRAGRAGRLVGATVERVIGAVHVGADLLGNDPSPFYDVIQRRRNWANASFCCGAGSVHRREAVTAVALRSLASQVERAVAPVAGEVEDEALRRELADAMTTEAVREIEVTPYKFHVSEDIFTSLVLHADTDQIHRSVFHPRPLTRMLSPQDLLSWTIQRYKYAGGTLDIFLHNPLGSWAGLSTWQKLMYGTTVYSYLSPLWVPVLLVTPLVYMFFGVTPLRTYDEELFGHLVPFLLASRIATMVATWGVRTWRGEQYYLASFWLNARALYDVLRRRPIRFVVTPKVRTEGNCLALVRPQLAVISLTVVGLVVASVRVVLGIEPLGPFLFNAYFAVFNVVALGVIVRAALLRPQEGA